LTKKVSAAKKSRKVIRPKLRISCMKWS